MYTKLYKFEKAVFAHVDHSVFRFMFEKNLQYLLFYLFGKKRER